MADEATIDTFLMITETKRLAEMEYGILIVQHNIHYVIFSRLQNQETRASVAPPLYHESDALTTKPPSHNFHYVLQSSYLTTAR